MTWIKIDDKLTSHPKWLPLTLEAKSLWFHASVWCGAHNNDGHVPSDAMAFIGFTASLSSPAIAPAADLLVQARLWARRSKKAGGGFDINDWLEYQPSKQQVKDRAESDELKQEHKALHDWLHKQVVGKKVKAIIDARDGMWCRYCGEQTVVTPGDRRSSQRRTYDLIDPTQRWDTTLTGLNAAEMEQIAGYWAVACGWCNAVKARRTPDEAGIELLVAPGERRPRRSTENLPRTDRNGSRTVPEVGTGLSGSDLDGHGRDLSGRPSPGPHAQDVPPPPTDADDPGEYRYG